MNINVLSFLNFKILILKQLISNRKKISKIERDYVAKNIDKIKFIVTFIKFNF